MEIIKLVVILLGSALLFTCCAAPDQPNLDYQQKPFRTHISWNTDNLTVCAVMTSLPATDLSSHALTLEFISPDSLGGIKITKNGQNTRVSLGDMEINDPHALGLLNIADFFNIDATVTESSVTELEGVRLNYIKATSDNGEEYSLFLFPASGLPRRICGKINGRECTLDVISFEFIPE